jgi:hypothetical protein
MRHNGQPNRKWRKFIHVSGLPEFAALDAATRRPFVAPATPVDPPRRDIKLPEGDLERIRAQVDAHIAEMERAGAIPKAAT